MDAMQASTSQHDDTPKPEDPPASPKRPKKMKYDKSPVSLPERTSGTSRRVAHKNGKV